MFSTYLETHPLISIIKEGRFRLFPPAGDPAWSTIPETYRQDLLALADKYRGIAYPMVTASQFMAFVRNGSRSIYEGPYFLRRKKLCAAMLGCCLSDSAEDLDAVADGIWCICEETSWVISAHNGSSRNPEGPVSGQPLPDKNEPYIDLFAAETAMILSLLCSILKEKLDAITPLLCQRITNEIEARILSPFMGRDDFWWTGAVRHDLNNWTPWIISNIMLTASLIINGRERLSGLLTRSCLMLDRYIDVLPEDGGCDEGAGYWNMAGGSLLDCLDLLERITDGRMVFWDDRKIRTVMRFPVSAHIGNGWFVNFADCDARPRLSGERLQYAGEKLHDDELIHLGSMCRSTPSAQLDDTAQLWRLLNDLFHPVPLKTQHVSAKDVWLPDLQVRILSKGGSTLAIKGGNNNENHNHNDVGSFILFTDNEPVVIDAGNMVYSAKTFSDQRYTLWNTRAMYHNIPLIGGMEQQAGSSYRAEKAQRTDDGMLVGFARAYPSECGIKVCERTAALDDDGTLLLEDHIECDRAQSVTWVFMLRSRPELTDSGVLSGGILITPTQEMKAVITEIPVDDRRMAGSYPGSIWRLTFESSEAAAYRVRFTCRRSSHA